MSCSYRYFRRQSVEASNKLTDKVNAYRTILGITFLAVILSVPPARGDDTSGKENTAASSKAKKRVSSAQGLGLDPANLRLVNHGSFKELAEKLKGQSGKHGTRDTAWLAFAYMYSGDCQSLDSLAKSFNQSGGADVNATLIQAFDLICKKKLDEAEKKLETIPASSMDDPFVNFAFAALAGKQGKASVAVTYTQRAITLAPEFAWGYRTIGFLQQRWLNQPANAEVAYESALAIEPDMTDAVNALVDLKLVRSDFDGAIDVAQAAIKKSPRDAGNYFRLAQIYMQQRRLREASNQLERAIALEPGNAKYFRTRSAVERDQGDWDAAIADLRKALELSSDKKFELTELASLEASAGKEDDAINHLLEAVKLDPSNQRANGQLVALLTRRGKFDQLATVLKGMVDKDPKNAVLRMYFADALAADNKITEAEEQYKEAANLNQTDPEPHRKLAIIAVSQKNFKQAEKEYTRALNINPNSTPDLVALGFCYAETDDYLQAEAGYVTALALHQLTQPADSKMPPTRLDIMRSLSTLLFKEGRYADAAAQFATVCAMSKALPEAPLDNLMLAQSAALRDRSSSSFKTLKEAFDKLADADKEMQRISCIDTLLRGGRYDEAITLLKEEDAKAKEPSPLVLVCWSRAWRGKNEIGKAEEAAKKAVDLSSKSGTPPSDFLYEYGEVLLAKGDLKGAAEKAHRALESNEKNFRAYELLARINLKEGKPNDAIAEATKAVEINPYFAGAYLVMGDAQMTLPDPNHLKDALASYQKAATLYPGLLPAHEALVNVLKKLSLAEELQKEETRVAELKGQQ